MENRKQAATRVSQKISRIAEAKALKKTHLESSMGEVTRIKLFTNGKISSMINGPIN